MTGAFITFEGGEGSGKSTQIKLLGEAFAKAGKSYLITREPGGSPGAERIRTLLVEGSKEAWDPIAETLLFYAARLEHVNRVVKPALASGKTVICDRFADSTLVYQGIGKGVSESFVRNLHEVSLEDFTPDLTIILDIDPTVGLKRAAARGGKENRFESMDFDFHRRIREGFLTIARHEPKRCAVLDAAQDPATLHQTVQRVLAEKLKIKLND